jgi:DNA polymerase III delta prime subunit
MDFIKFSKSQIPSTIDDTLLHTSKKALIKKIKILQNTIFYGYEGKSVLIHLLLKNIFSNIKIKVHNFNILKKTIKTHHSDYHLEIDVKDILKNEPILIDLIKEYTSTYSIVNSTYKVVVIYNFDLLNEKLQFRLRTVIEKLSITNRFILHTSRLSKIIKPIQSRCISIRIPIITYEDAYCFIKSIMNMNKENMNKVIKSASLTGIISIRKILSILFIKLESRNYKIRYTINFNKSLELINKKLYLAKPLNEKIEELNSIILTTLDKNETPESIMKYLVYEILRNDNITNEKKYNIIEKTAFHERIINKGRSIINLETYIIYLLTELNTELNTQTNSKKNK